MKSKGRRAWLITWEGDEAEKTGRPKVVIALPPQVSEDNVKSILELLYNSEYPFLTLCEKIGFAIAREREKPRYFRYNYREVNSELHYGDLHCFLCARQVKNLVCEETDGYPCECKVSWTELAKYVYDEKLDKAKLVREEMERSYASKHP